MIYGTHPRIDGDDYNDTLETGEFSEVDFTLSYGFDIKPVAVSIGYIEYLFPTSGNNTREAFSTLGVDIYKGLYATVGFYYDFDEVDDFYAKAGLGYHLSVGKKFSLDFSALAGYVGDNASLAQQSGFHEYTLSAAGTYTITNAFSVSAKLNFLRL